MAVDSGDFADRDNAAGRGTAVSLMQTLVVPLLAGLSTPIGHNLG
jgi:hypothetical protein